MPMPVYLMVGTREVSVTSSEARQLAALLPPGLCQAEIQSHADNNISRPIPRYHGGDERANMAALEAALASIEEEGELSPALKTLRKSIETAMAEQSGLAD